MRPTTRVTHLPANLLSDLQVLLLEDEYLIAMDVELLCRDHGAADVIIRHSLDGLDGDPPDFDVAILDLLLAGDPTLPFAERLASLGRPFVFASGYGENEEVRRRFPDVPIVAKPYAGADLINAVAAVCGRL